jgi:hypothetical protein
VTAKACRIRDTQLAAFLSREAKIAKVLGTETRPNEDITQAIQRIAGTGAGADDVVQARATVPAQARQKIAANTIARLGRNARVPSIPGCSEDQNCNREDHGAPRFGRLQSQSGTRCCIIF